jgi:3-deoxy-manno-octulosonate cytidylyltransferase (CMP-KDO synthetase)
MKTIVIIPARMASARLPGKPLKKINGKSIILECYRNALFSAVDNVFVTSPDPDIFNEVMRSGRNFISTSNYPINGTERVAEAARILQLEDDDIVVNLQGDMPFFDSEIIDAPVRLLKGMHANATSAMKRLSKKDYNNPNRVKVNVNNKGMAISFSRIYKENAYLHIGVYVFRNSFLQKYAKFGEVYEEMEEGLEQQRIMHMGEDICMAYVSGNPVVIDCIEDLERARHG